MVALTGYTYWAAKKGMDFNFLGPVLFTSLVVLVFFGLIQVIHPLQSSIRVSSEPELFLSWYTRDDKECYIAVWAVLFLFFLYALAGYSSVGV